MCLGTVTSKTGRRAVQPLRSKGSGWFRGLCFSLVYEVLTVEKDALGAVCSLLYPGCDSGFDRDEVKVNVTLVQFFAVDVTALCTIRHIKIFLLLSVI